MGRYLDPKYDLPFKLIFGEHKNLCISLINSMLPFDDDRKVESIEYETSELIPEIRDLKHSVVDVRCTDNYNRQFIVEMQMTWTESFKSRVLLNASKAYVRKFDATQDYKLLYPVYAINFVNKVFEKSPEMQDEYYHHYQIVNVRHTEKRIEGLELIFIELPKFKPHTRATRKLHELWLRFLTEINESTEEAPAELLSDENIREAVHYTEVGAYSKGQLLAYDIVKMAVVDERSLLSGWRDEGIEEGRAEGLAKGLAEGLAKGLAEGREEGLAEGREEGVAKGREEGMAKGREEGREEGLAEGREEGREEGVAKGREEGMAKGREEGRVEVAVNALKKGMSPEVVSEFTGLSLNEIHKLKDRL